MCTRVRSSPIGELYYSTGSDGQDAGKSISALDRVVVDAILRTDDAAAG